MKTQNLKSIVLIEPDNELLRFYESLLSSFYFGDVVTNETDKVDLSGLDPELIILDESFVTSSLFSEFQKIKAPLIVTSKNPEGKVIPGSTGVVAKPLTPDVLKFLVKSLSKYQSVTPTHVKISIELLEKNKKIPCDLFFKLSDKNYVKFMHTGSLFSQSDYQKLEDKNVREVFINFNDSGSFLEHIEKQLFKEALAHELFELSLDSIETFESIAKSLKWSPEVIIATERIVSQAVKNLSKNKNIMTVLKNRKVQKGSIYSEHIGLLTYLVTAFSCTFDWVKEGGQIKLAYASLMHDFAVDDEKYLAIENWNRKASHVTGQSMDTLEYRMHPIEAAKLTSELEVISADVEQIILQHHETPDGRGFPRGIDHTRIGHLSSLFIMVEDLVNFITYGEKVETSLKDFLTWGREKYNKGHFKKIFDEIEKGLVS